MAQCELKQLTEAGLIERDRDGHPVYYTANRQSPIIEELRTIIEKPPARLLRAKFRRGHAFVKRVMAEPKSFISGGLGELERLAR